MCKRLIYLTCFGLVLGLALTNAANAQEPGLVGWWKFDECEGTTVADSSGNGNDGTVYGDPQWIDGYFGCAIQFDGIDDYIDLPISSIIGSLTNSTFTMWVDWSGSGGAWQRIFDFGSSTTFNMFLTPNNGYTGTPRFAITLAGWQDEDQVNTEEFLLTGWHHVAVTIDADNATHSLIIDGQVVGQNTATRHSPSDLGETTQHWLARSEYAADPYFNGSLDDFRIYSHVLSDLEIHIVVVDDARLAWAPRPADGEVDVYLDTQLIWNPGVVNKETLELYNEHHVYFGTDFNDVNSSTEPTAVITDENEYATPLDYDTTYYWRVDEASSLDPNSPVKGEVWSFTTANFIVVEDFEDYNDFPPDEIWNTWIDGYGDPANGATAGYPNPAFFAGEHYMEDEIVHGGSWSMPLFYDNSEAGLSEVTRTFNTDWTADDVVTLTLWYYGDAGNTVEPMYVALNGNAIVTNDNARAVLVTEWTRWDTLLQEFADQGVSFANVNTMSIGMGNKANPQAGGGTGHVFIDDIRLYRSLPEEVEPEPESVDPGTNNLIAYYAFENNAQDGSGNGYNATLSGNPLYVQGPTGYGMAIDFDGTGDYVTLPIGPAIASMTDITIATWADFSNAGGAWQRIWDFGTGEDNYMFMSPRISTGGPIRFAITTSGGGGESQVTAPDTLPTGWHHVAASIDSASMTMKIYQDGKLVVEGPTETLPSDLGQTNQNWLARSQYVADAYYQGSLDEFRIYDRALSEVEILYLAGK